MGCQPFYCQLLFELFCCWSFLCFGSFLCKFLFCSGSLLYYWSWCCLWSLCDRLCGNNFYRDSHVDFTMEVYNGLV